MNIENNLKKLIEVKSGSVRAFSIEADIPYTTLRSILERGIMKANIENVFKIAKHLGMKPEQITDLGEANSTIVEIIENTIQLNGSRQTKVREFAEHELEEQNKVIDLNDYLEETMQGYLSAGTGEYLSEAVAEPVRIPKSIVPEQHYDLVLQVNGDSMEPMFENKEYVFVRKTKEVRSGQIGVFIIDGESYLKKAYINDDHLRLVSLNKEYEDLTFDSINDITLIGTVVL